MKPCRKCGSTNRGKRGQCLPCDATRSRRRYATHKGARQASCRAWYVANKDRANAQSKLRSKKNPERRAEVNERSRLKKYNLTLEQYRGLLERQAGKCLICREAFTKRIHIDHDHTNGAIRGLLCHHCNVGLGHFRDNPSLLREAATYLEKVPALQVPLVQPKSFDEKDGRFKVSAAVRAAVLQLRAQGFSLAVVAQRVGLSRSWVQVVAKQGLC